MEIAISQSDPHVNQHSDLAYESPPAKHSEKLSAHDDLRSGFTSTADTHTLSKVEEFKEKPNELDNFDLNEDEDLQSDHAGEEDEDLGEDDKNFSDLDHSSQGLNSSGFNSDGEDHPSPNNDQEMIIGTLRQS